MGIGKLVMKLSDAIEKVIDNPLQIGCPVCNEVRARMDTIECLCKGCPFHPGFMFEEFGVRVPCAVLRTALERSYLHEISRNGSVYKRVKFVREMMMNLRSIGD